MCDSRHEKGDVVMNFFKGIINLALVICMVVGLVMMITEIPETTDIITIIKVNGSGAILFSISLLLLQAINKEDGKEMSI